MAPTIEVFRNGRGHSYALDGRPTPGVTTLIRGGLPSPALMYWSANQAAEYAVEHWADWLQRDERGDLRPSAKAYELIRKAPWAQRDRAAEFGTDVHRYARLLVADEAVDVPAHQAAHVDQCLRFFDDHAVEPVASERPVANVTRGYCGTFDLIADTRHGRLLLDYKTGAGVYVEVALQLAAYRFAEWLANDAGDVVPMIEVDGCAVVHLRDDSYDVVPIVADEDTFRTFLHTAAVATRADALRDTFKGAPL